MPYANIHWIKLKLELLNDKRFIFDCNNDQKWLFIGLLLLAGSTKNSIADDENYIKNRLNLPETSQKIRENIDHLLKTFPKLITRNGVVKFKNFNEIHNKLGNYFGTPLELQENANGNKDKIREEKIREEQINKVRLEFVRIKGLDIKNFFPDDYARTGKAIKNLVFKAGGKEDLVLEALAWMGKQSYEWSLETVIKKWADFMKYKETPDILKKYGKKEGGQK